MSAGLHPQVRALMDAAAAREGEAGPPDLEAERAAYLQTALELGGPVEEVARVEDVVIPDAEGGLDVTVADARFAKPLDAGLLAQLAAEHDLLVTVEEGVLAGGFGSAVWECLNDGGGHVPRILRIGLPDRYVAHGKPALLHAEVGFTGAAIAKRVVDTLAGADAPTSPLTA